MFNQVIPHLRFVLFPTNYAASFFIWKKWRNGNVSEASSASLPGGKVWERLKAGGCVLRGVPGWWEKGVWPQGFDNI